MTHFTSNYYYTLMMTWVSCIFAWIYSLSHPFSLTIITHVGGSNGVNTEPMKHWLPFLNNTNPLLNPRKSFLITEHWVQIYSNQKEINYISPFIIRAGVKTRPLKLHNLLQFSPPFHPWHVMPSPPRPKFCDTTISSNDNDDDDDTSKSNLPVGWIQDIFTENPPSVLCL